MPHRLVIPFIPPGNGRRGVKEGLGGTGKLRGEGLQVPRTRIFS